MKPLATIVAALIGVGLLFWVDWRIAAGVILFGWAIDKKPRGTEWID